VAEEAAAIRLNRRRTVDGDRGFLRALRRNG
jgi:hypothetical protein